MLKWKTIAVVLTTVLLSMAVPAALMAQEDVTEAEEMMQSAEETQTEEEDDGTWNLLLIGSDRRDSSWNGNSDTMILLTINENVETSFLVSFMRDTAAAIPGHSTQKLNAAYAIGGAQLLEETLESNFGVHIDNYAAVDFESIVAIIDDLGGVDIEQSSEEIAVTNGYVNSLCSAWGLDASAYLVSEGQTHLNGLQALAYMRDRYVGNDYERTARQRKVLTTLLSAQDLSDPSEMMELAQTLLSYVDTDLNLLDLLTLSSTIPHLAEYEIVTDRIPYDGLYSSSGEMLVPVQPDTNDRLLAEIYAQ